MTVTKMELGKALTEKLGWGRVQAMEFVDAFFDEIIDTLASGKEVKLSGFGAFVLLDKRQRPGRNPKTGTEVPITPRRVVSFQASQKLKSRVAQKKH